MPATFSVPARLPRSWAPPSMHVHLQGLHVDGHVARGLHGVAVEGDLLLPAEGADLRDGLDGADLVVGEHDGHQGGILPDGGFQVRKPHHPVLVHVQQRHLEALFFQLRQGVQHGVVFKLGGDQVPLALPGAQAGGGDDGLIVGLGAAGGEIDLPGIGVEAAGHGLPGLLQRLLGVLTEGIQAGGVAVLLGQIGQHGVQRGFGNAGGSGVVGVDKHELFILSFLAPLPEGGDLRRGQRPREKRHSRRLAGCRLPQVAAEPFFHFRPVSRSSSVTVFR